jgi:hypothetical protein
MDRLNATHLLTLTLDVAFANMLDIGPTAAGRRRIAPVSGGTFEGERLRGVVLPDGADWVINRADGVMLIDVRLALQTDDNASIYLRYTGNLRATPDAMKRFNRGEPLKEDEYKLRTIPVFETGAEKYVWLNDMVCVGIGQRLPTGQPRYAIFEV